MKNISIDSDLNLFSDDIKIDTSELSSSIDNVIKKIPKKSIITMDLGGDAVKKIESNLMGLSTNISANGTVSINLDCQDETYKLQHGWFRKIYFYRQPKNTQGEVYTPKDEIEEDINFTTGKKYAKDIIEDAVNSASSGTKIIWEPGVYNYEVVNKNHPYQNYNATVSSVISTILNPLQHTSMYRVQAIMINGVLHIRKQYVSGRARKISINFEEIYGKEVSINYSRLTGAHIKHIVIEYFQENSVDLDIIVSKTIENTIDPETKNLLSSIVRYTSKILDVVISEKEEFYRGVDGKVVLVSNTTTNYTYDISPDELDEDGRFKPHRKLMEKNISQENYLVVFTPPGALGSGQKKTDVVSEISTIINYKYNTKDELIDESEKTETKYYGELTETRNVVTVYKQIKADLIETLRTTYINAETSTIVSITTEGRLQKSAALLYNENENPYSNKKYIKESGTDDNNDQIVYLSSDYLPIGELRKIAKEIIKERDYIKVIVTVQGLSMPWLNRGDEVVFTGKLLVRRADKDNLPVLIAGTNKYEETKTEVISFITLSNTPMIVESQNFTAGVKGNTGSLVLVGYKRLV